MEGSIKPDKLFGVVVPIVTPVDDEDRVDEPAFRKLIRYLIDAGVHGLFVGGSAGEGPLLTSREWTRMVEIAYDEVDSTVPLLGGAMEMSTQRVLEKVQILKQIGYVNFAITPTFYQALKSPAEHLRLFGTCKDSLADLEMVAYNIPSTTGSSIPVETMIDMARRGWIRYCKESSGDPTYYTPLLAAAKPVGLNVFMGDESNIAGGLLAGACGVVPVCANYEPETFIHAYEASLDHDTAELWRMQERVMILRQKLPLLAPCWIAGVKYGVASLGMGSGKPVSPLQPLTAQEKQIVDEMTRAKESR
jgi:4-hydroxy-tetrahydrodipicolinate synthase